VAYFQTEPSNPFKSDREKAKKNMLTGFVEPAHFNPFHFDRAIRSYDSLGYAQNPSEAATSSKFVGDVVKAQEVGGISLYESKKTGGEKRKRVASYEASDINNFTGKANKWLVCSPFH